LEQRRAGVKHQHPSLSVTSQCHLLNISRSGLYYRPAAVSEEGLHLMKLIDRQYLLTPFYGTRRMAVWLWKSHHLSVNRKHIRRLMAKMGLRTIYRRPRTSTPATGHKVFPYLLNGLKITRPNQVWATDITFIPMAHGFMYLVAIMDWYSRYVLAWRLSNTLDADFCIDALEEALRKGNPEIFNTDQGSQFTGEGFTGMLERHGILISMDGKGSYNDNLFIERLWRTVKYEEVYLKAYVDGREVKGGIGGFFRFYNNERPHQSLSYRTPAEVYHSIPVDDIPGSLIESLVPVTLRTAGLHLNLAPVLS
jgi:putative transposase